MQRTQWPAARPPPVRVVRLAEGVLFSEVDVGVHDRIGPVSAVDHGFGQFPGTDLAVAESGRGFDESPFDDVSHDQFLRGVEVLERVQVGQSVGQDRQRRGPVKHKRVDTELLGDGIDSLAVCVWVHDPIRSSSVCGAVTRR